MTRSVLVVDDDDAVRTLIAHLARQAGLHVRTAGSGQEADRMLQAQVPEVLVADVRMPRPDGLDLLQQVRQREPAPRRIILVSAYPPHTWRQPEAAHQADVVLTKPFDAVDLRAALGPRGIPPTSNEAGPPLPRGS